MFSDATAGCSMNTPCPEKMVPLYFASNFARCSRFSNFFHRQT